jgi:hypothetical protein
MERNLDVHAIKIYIAVPERMRYTSAERCLANHRFE